MHKFFSETIFIYTASLGARIKLKSSWPSVACHPMWNIFVFFELIFFFKERE